MKVTLDKKKVIEESLGIRESEDYIYVLDSQDNDFVICINKKDSSIWSSERGDTYFDYPETKIIEHGSLTLEW